MQILVKASIVLALSIVTIYSQSEFNGPVVRFKSPFRYTIVADVTEIQKKVNAMPFDRTIEVLMDPGAFNEKNLRVLFGLLDKRYIDREVLTVYVYTSLSSIRTPEEYDRMGLWGPVENVDKEQNARFFRSKEQKYIEYFDPGKGGGRINIRN